MKTAISFLFVLFAFVSFSQNKSVKSKFSYLHTVTFFGNESISRSEDLFYNGNESVFVVYGKDLYKPSEQKSITKPGGKGNIALTMNGADDSKDFVLYKNYTSRTMISREFLDNGDKCIVTDSLPQLKWQMTPETKLIGSYKCQKAITTFRCATYTAWFTSSIPLPIGPWKIGGLPGLIVELTDRRENVTYKYSLIKAEYPSNDASYVISPQASRETKYSFTEYAAVQNRHAEKQRKFASASAVDPTNSGYINTRPECYELGFVLK